MRLIANIMSTIKEKNAKGEKHMNTQTQEALKMAIEALAKCKEAYLAGPNWQKVGYDILDKSQQACKEALKNLEKDLSIWSAQEPVGWQFYDDEKWWNGVNEEHKKSTIEAGYKVRNVFTLPSAQEPVA